MSFSRVTKQLAAGGIFLVFFGMVGCSGVHRVESIPTPIRSFHPTKESAEALRSSVRRATEQYERGAYRESIVSFEAILQKYMSEDGRLEIGVLTSLCLACLETNENRLFDHYAELLADHVKSSKSYVSEETQFMLAIHEIRKTGGFEGKGISNQRITNYMNVILKEGGVI